MTPPRRCQSALHLALAILLMVLVFTLDVACAEEQGKDIRSSRQLSRRLSYFLAESFPDICKQNVHWVIAVDVSGSMAGPKLDWTKDALDEFLKMAAVPGDRVSEVLFDTTVRDVSITKVDEQIKASPNASPSSQMTHGEIGSNRESLIIALKQPMDITTAEEGTDVTKARRHVLELGKILVVSQTPYSRRVVTLVITDTNVREGTTEKKKADESLTKELGREFGSFFSSSGGGDGSGSYSVETMDPVTLTWKSDIVKQTANGKEKEQVEKTGQLFFFASIERLPPPSPLASPTIHGVTEIRKVYLEKEQIDSIPGSDPFHRIRLFLELLPWGLLVVVIGGVAWLALAACAGHASTRESAVSLPWKPWSKGLAVPATTYPHEFAFRPSRQGMNSPVVFKMKASRALDWCGPSLHVVAVPPFQIKTAETQWVQDVVIAPGEEVALSVRDKSGEVGTDKFTWRGARPTVLGYRVLCVMAATVVLMLLFHPWVMDRVPAPIPPTTKTTTVVPLCP